MTPQQQHLAALEKKAAQYLNFGQKLPEKLRRRLRKARRAVGQGTGSPKQTGAA